MADGARDPLDITTTGAISRVASAQWDALANPAGARRDPFVSHAFLDCLEESGCVSERAGWAPQHLLARDGDGRLVGAMPLYLKTHSYGEYVFDHAWADALRRAGGRYYPKLQSAAPFTPVTGRRLLAATPDVERALAVAAVSAAQALDASSVHVTFLTEGEWRRLAPLGFLQRTGVQFHWDNPGYASFQDFLAALSSGKRKTIRRERERAVDGIEVKRLRGADITTADWDFFFRCYQDTGARKWGTPYLNRDFFDLLGARMGEDCVLFIAMADGRPVASALNLLGSDTIYGRYWGCVADVPFLHFELCYYQAIDFAIEHKLARVEAGAQGEHKLLRGYAPVATYSAHWIAHPGLRDAVADYLSRERPAIANEIEALDQHTPFRKDLSPN